VLNVRRELCATELKTKTHKWKRRNGIDGMGVTEKEGRKKNGRNDNKNRREKCGFVYAKRLSVSKSIHRAGDNCN
jgi:hypothetical protein